MLAAISTFELCIWIVLCAVMVFLSGVFSGAETGLYSINTTRLRLEAHQKNRRALRLQEILRDRAAFLFTVIFGTNMANYLAPVCLTIIFVRSLTGRSPDEVERLAELYTTLILTPVVFVFGEAVPKNVFNRNADRYMLLFSRFLRWAHRFCEISGIIWLQRKFSELAFRGLSSSGGAGAPVQSRLDVYQMLRESAAEGALTLTQVAILERIGRLRGLRVSAVMVPFYQIVQLQADADRTTAEPVLRISRFSRLPVFGSDRRRIIGVVHVLDLLTSPPGRTALDLMRSPVEITPETRVIDALARLQREFRRMAIIVDGRGQCLGIVTVKDLVEEIVGELKAW